MDCLRWRGNDDEDHHSRNLRKNMDVGRIRFNDDAKRGKSFVLMKVMGDRDKEVLPAKSGGEVTDGCRQHINKVRGLHCHGDLIVSSLGP